MSYICKNCWLFSLKKFGFFNTTIMCNADVKKTKHSGRGERKSTKGKPRPEYKRHVKSPYSYVELITMAIRSSPSKMKTLREILNYMQAKFPCFRGSYVGWKNSVRHNLSAAKCFTKVLRNTERPFGKDNYWTMNLACSHCFAMKSGGPAQRRKESTKTSRASSTSSDHGFHSQDNAFPEWVANQAAITRVPSSAASDEPQMQYTELCHKQREQNTDISRLDFETNINRIDPATWPFSGQSSSRTQSSSCDNWSSENSRFDSHPNTSTRASSSSVAESWTTQSSGFESSSKCFDFDMTPAADDLDAIMDDLFVPEDDIDLFLYGEWSGNHGNQSNNSDVKTEVEKSYIAESSPVTWSTKHPPSPYSTSSAISEIRTSITPQPSTLFPIRICPPSPHSYSHPSSLYSTCGTTSEDRTSTLLEPHPCKYVQQEMTHQDHHLQGTFYHQQYPSYASSVTQASRCAATLPPSLHSSKILPTFESMFTNAVRDGLNLNFESVTESISA